jgi:hypothetical protein
MTGDNVQLVLNKDQALVLFEWLTNLDSSGSAPADGSAESKVLWKIEGQLERTLVVPLRGNYRQLVEDARRKVLTSDASKYP